MLGIPTDLICHFLAGALIFTYCKILKIHAFKAFLIIVLIAGGKELSDYFFKNPRPFDDYLLDFVVTLSPIPFLVIFLKKFLR